MRSYRVIKLVKAGDAPRFLVVAPDLLDPDMWALINEFGTAAGAWAYVREVKERAQNLAKAAK